MHVRAGRAARAADDGDRIALLHRLARAHEVARIVAIARHVAGRVRDLDDVAVTVLVAGIRDDARPDGDDTCGPPDRRNRRPRGTRRDP